MTSTVSMEILMGYDIFAVVLYLRVDLCSNQSNILIDDTGNPLLADFGRLKISDHRGFTTGLLAGVVRFMAPELYDSELDDDDASENPLPSLTKESDVFAFSMVTLMVS